MSAVAGWYADPSGTSGQLRWWDGTAWTEHVTADPNAPSGSAEPEPQTTPAAPWGASESASTSDAGEVPPPPGAPGAAIGDGAPVWGSGAAVGATTPVWGSGTAGTPAWGSGSGTAGTPAWGSGTSGSGAWTAPPAPQRSGARVGLIIAIVVIGLGLVLVGVVFAGLFAIRSSTSGVSVTSETFSGQGATDPTTSTDLAVGGSISATIPEGGALEAIVTVDEPGMVTFDVRGDDGFDARLEVLDPTGASIADNDDRDDLGDGSRTFDPFLELDLAPGTYRAIVDGWAGNGGSFELTIR